MDGDFSSYPSVIKPEPIMLSVLPLFLPEFPIIFTHYSYFIPMPSPIIPVIFFKLLVSVTMRSTVYLVAPK